MIEREYVWDFHNTFVWRNTGNSRAFDDFSFKF